jgi:hypothetical protein
VRSLRLLILIVLTAVYVSAAPGEDPKLLVHSNANLRESATTQSAIKAHLDPGIELTQILPTKHDGFYKVRTPDGTEGWVYHTLVHVIEEDDEPTPTLPAASATFDSTWARPVPVGSILPGPPGKQPCPPNGELGGDIETNRRKNRKDVPTSYNPVTFSALKSLSYPEASTNRKNWTAAQTAAIEPFEGVAVSVAGFIVAVKKQSGGSGEATNCHFSQTNFVDVHVALVENIGDGEKESVVVEPTPRFYAAHPTWVWSQLKALDDSPDLVRISGWTLLDPVHKGHLGKYRATLWEIHPITKIEVFKNGQWKDW